MNIFHTYIKCLCALLLVVFTHQAQAADENGKIENVKFEVGADRMLTITYDLLKTGKGEHFDIRVIIIDSTFKKHSLHETGTSGDIGENISYGTGKKIVVDLSLLSYIHGAQKVEVSSIAHQVLGGPSNALVSALIPGMGNVFVYKKSAGTTQFLCVASLVAGVGLLAMIKQSEYQSNMDNYRSLSAFSFSPVAMTEAAEYKRKADESLKSSRMFTSVALGIWAADVVWVAAKGFKNVHDRRKAATAQTRLNMGLLPVSAYGTGSGVPFNLRYSF